jgi:hypothetical protein
VKIACIGWGSLVWQDDHPKAFAQIGPWKPGGPGVKVEFARISKDHRVTLVLDRDSPTSQAWWCLMEAQELRQAVKLLADREGIGEVYQKTSVGSWKCGEPEPENPFSLALWASQNGVDAVIWTKLGCSSPNPSGGDPIPREKPSLSKLIEHVIFFKNDTVTHEKIREYVEKAPAEIITTYRKDLENFLGIERI